ncbi:MAG TPA: ATP-dependent DNA ligase [Nitrososphaerales archaeon]|nr:ATP-dependent DNA ligase [Nitrososphaerales archaeon]
MTPGPRFRDFAELLERVKQTPSKNEKVRLLADYLLHLDPPEAETAARLATGRPSERGAKDEAQVGYSTLVDVLKEVCGATSQRVSQTYLRHGDLGEVAEELLKEKKEQSLFPDELSLEDIREAFGGLRSAKGKGSSTTRRAVVKSLLLRASPLEGKYIVKVLTGEMRTGLVQGLVEEAVAKAFSVSREDAARAHMLVGDVGLFARAAATHDLSAIRISQFRPVNFMLAEPVATAAEVASHFGKEAYAEYKYDGVRAQVHKLGGVVRIYSRRLEDITPSFPELVEAAGQVDEDFILDGEIVPFRDERPLPFQLLQRRLRRQEDFEAAVKNAPVLYFAFDILLRGGEEEYLRPLSVRRKELGRLIGGSRIRAAHLQVVRTEAEVASIFRQSRDLGYEGLVVKDPASVYVMGKRGAGWVKLKEELDTIDAVIIAAEYGHGKRAGVISDYTFAVRDGEELRTIGKAYSGLTDEEIIEMTRRLKEITLKDFGYRRTVEPEVVIEVAFDSIQRSTRHDSGYALRFPRIKRIRTDKSLADIDTLEKVASIFRGQRLKVDGAESSVDIAR